MWKKWLAKEASKFNVFICEQYINKVAFQIEEIWFTRQVLNIIITTPYEWMRVLKMPRFKYTEIIKQRGKVVPGPWVKLFYIHNKLSFLQKAGFLPNIVEYLSNSNIPLKMLISKLLTESKLVKYFMRYSFLNINI